MEIVILLALVVLVLVNVYQIYQRRPDPLVKKTVIVNTPGGDAVRGVLLHQHSDRLTLNQASYMNGRDGKETPIDNVVHVPKDQIHFIQELRP